MEEVPRHLENLRQGLRQCSSHVETKKTLAMTSETTFKTLRDVAQRQGASSKISRKHTNEPFLQDLVKDYRIPLQMVTYRY